MNGLRPENNNFILDGVDNNDALVNTIIFFSPAEAIEEFRVNTSVAPAEYGRGGGAIIQSTLSLAATKSMAPASCSAAAVSLTHTTTVRSGPSFSGKRNLAARSAALSGKTNSSYSEITRGAVRISPRRSSSPPFPRQKCGPEIFPSSCLQPS